jgi:undecaprenyl-diphosphatase
MSPRRKRRPEAKARPDPRFRVADFDRQVMTRVASGDVPNPHGLWPRLSRSANSSLLWIAIAAGLGATGDKRARRAALRGLVSVAIASSTANVLVKGLARRNRPDLDIPVVRLKIPAPRSSSFPSGHSASAAAFATGVALEMPSLALPIGALAAAVGTSRVVNGVHYPSDVLAGFAIGTAAGVLTVRWWPLRPARPTVAAVRRQLPLRAARVRPSYRPQLSDGQLDAYRKADA